MLAASEASARPRRRPAARLTAGLCISAAALAAASKVSFVPRHLGRSPRRTRCTCLLATATKGAVLRSTFNSFQEDLYDREALRLDEGQALDAELEARMERVAQLCKLTEKTRVLDVGCGSGVMLPFYERAGASLSRVTGLDLSQGMLTHARRAYPSAEFIRGDIHNFEDPDFRLFDRVVFNNCYHHLHDQQVALRHVTEELISGGGLVVISDPRGKQGALKDKKAHPHADLRDLPSKNQLAKAVEKQGSGTTGVHSFTSSLLSVESVVDEEDFYCAILRRSCADF